MGSGGLFIPNRPGGCRRDPRVKLTAVAEETPGTDGITTGKRLRALDPDLHIAVVTGFSEVLLLDYLGGLTERQREYISDIHSAGIHLLGIVNDILDLSRIEADRLEITIQPVALHRLILSCHTFVRERAEKARVAIHMRPSDAGTVVRTDERIAKQILVNLLTNAVKFTPAGGRVAVEVGGADPGGYFMRVEDAGIGMTAEELTVALEPFGRVGDVLTRQQDGTGLGLFLVQALVRRLGGTMRIESMKDIGTTVTVMIPESSAGDRGDEAPGHRSAVGSPGLV